MLKLAEDNMVSYLDHTNYLPEFKACAIQESGHHYVCKKFIILIKQVEHNDSNLITLLYRWLSSVRFKYKPGYRPCDLSQIQVHSLVENCSFFRKRPLQDLLSSLNDVISTNERVWIITGDKVYNLAYT